MIDRFSASVIGEGMSLLDYQIASVQLVQKQGVVTFSAQLTGCSQTSASLIHC